MSNPPQSRYSQATFQRERAPTSSGGNLCCNKCSRPLATTVFVCSCDCVFCEDCTFSHFENSASCPSCGHNLRASDFLELGVADPSAASSEDLKHAFQSLFTKISATTKTASKEEMCLRVLKALENDRRVLRFLLKQFVLESKASSQKSGSIGRAYESAQQEITHLKQTISTQKIQQDQLITDLENRLQSLQGKLEEKETQVRQFRQMCSGDNIALVPNSSHSYGSNGSRGSGLQGYESTGSRGSGGVPPMQAFRVQKQAQEREKAARLDKCVRSSGPLRRRLAPDVTPIVPPSYPPSRSHASQRSQDVSARVGEYNFTSRPSQSSNSPSIFRPVSNPEQRSGYPSFSSRSSSSFRRSSSIRRR